MHTPKLATTLAAAALAVAVLGATPVGHAAGRLILPSNSVGIAQLKKNAVTGLKVRDGSLTAADFRGPLPAGPKGDSGAPGTPGPKGDRGPAGPSDASVATGSGTMIVPASSSLSKTIELIPLDPGSYVLSAVVTAWLPASTGQSARVACFFDHLGGNVSRFDHQETSSILTLEDQVRFATVPVTGAVTVSTATSVTLRCQDTGPNLVSASGSIIATKVGELH